MLMGLSVTSSNRLAIDVLPEERNARGTIDMRRLSTVLVPECRSGRVPKNQCVGLIVYMQN